MAATLDEGHAGYLRSATPDGPPVLPTPGPLLFDESVPEVAGLVYRRLAEAFHRLSTLFAGRLGYPDDAPEPQAVAGAFVALWFVAVYGGSAGTGDRRIAPTDAARRALELYATGLAELWDRPGPATPTAAGEGPAPSGEAPSGEAAATGPAATGPAGAGRS